MIDGTGLALVCGAIALHAYDASLLLFRDEVLFTHGRRGWQATLGSGVTLGGRYLAMAGAWTPALPVFRACWSDDATRAAPRAPMPALLRALRPLQWASCVLALLLFVGMPLGLWWHVGHAWMLALVVALYGTAFACVAWIWRHRRVFGLDRKAFASVAFDVVACPPFAVNVVRKLTLRLGLPRPAEAFARDVLPPAECMSLMRDAHARMHPGAIDGEPLP